MTQSRDADALQYAIVLAVCIVDGADMAVLGAAYRNFEQDLGMTPLTLGLMTLAQALAGALSAPVWGWLCDSGVTSRRVLWTIGTFGWALMMLALAFTWRFSEIISIRLFNGIFLACLGPLTQSWVAEQVPVEKSGRIFGFLFAATTVGATGSTLFITTLGENTFYFGGLIEEMAGWRFVCLLISAASLVLSVVIWALMDEEVSSGRSLSNLRSGPAEIIRNLREHWRIETFRIVVFQGVVGGIPWSALSFRMMFFQYLGFSAHDIGLIVSMEMVPRMVGGLLGGLVGDWATSISPYHGRAYTGQFCLAATIPLMLLQVIVLPSVVGPSVWPYITASITFTLLASWTPAGVIRPVFLEVTRPGCRASILAWQTALEGMSSAVLGAPLVGLLAEDWFGYTQTSQDVSVMDPELRAHNFRALQSSLSVMTTTPWILCFIAISMLHWSYKRDAGKGLTNTSEDKSGKKLEDTDFSCPETEGYGATSVQK